MLKRPLAPFRSRPMRKAELRKGLAPDVIEELAAELPLGFPSLRKHGRTIKSQPDRLRVLKPESDET